MLRDTNCCAILFVFEEASIVNVNVCVRLAAGLMVLTMLNTPAAWPQNPPSTPQNTAPAAQSPPSAAPSTAQTPGAAPAQPAGPATSAPATRQQAEPLPEYLLQANGPPETMPRRYIEMWNTGDFELMRGMFATQVWLHYPGHDNFRMLTPIVVGRINMWRACMPDLNFQILDTIVQRDKVVLRLVYTGTYEKQCYDDVPGPVSGAPPVKIHVNEVLIFGLDHGKISDIWEQYDELGARLQMGAKWRDTTESLAAKP
jgi:hypothetical protein